MGINSDVSRKVHESSYVSIWKSRFSTVWVDGEINVLEHILCVLLWVRVERCYV